MILNTILYWHAYKNIKLVVKTYFQLESISMPQLTKPTAWKCDLSWFSKCKRAPFLLLSFEQREGNHYEPSTYNELEIVLWASQSLPEVHSTHKRQVLSLISQSQKLKFRKVMYFVTWLVRSRTLSLELRSLSLQTPTLYKQEQMWGLHKKQADW